MNEPRRSGAFRRIRLTLAALVLVILPALPVLPAASAPPAPAGLTAFTQQGGVALAWQPVTGATNYQVFRSTTLGGVGTQIAAPLGTTYKDTAVSNGTTYFYRVKAVSGSASPASAIAQATPRGRTCSTGNPVVVENCFPGTTAWKLAEKADAFSGGLDGFATKSSVNRGESVDLKVKAIGDYPYRIEIYRTGWYGGSQGRLVSVLPNRTGTWQNPCNDGSGNTGLKDCSNWVVTDTITTSAEWAPGIYLLRLVRTDTGRDSHILLTIRNDDASTDVLYVLPTSTYQAYNAYGGKSTYTYNSIGADTIAGTPRAVKVSFDRPYDQNQRDWFTGEDIRNLSWLERQGYDMGYTTSEQQHTGIRNLDSRKAIISGVHDEYYSSQMRSGLTNARNAGAGILFFGANGVYWRVRFEASPFSRVANRVMVVYKTTEGGPDDPSGTATGTWRDPAGANDPENSLIGQQYIGQNTGAYSPLTVSAAQGQHRIWRYTSVGSLASGTSQSIGSTLVGWEWDARASNGREPAGVTTVASTAVQGDILQDAGRVYAPGNAVQQSTYYRAGATGGVVFATGTNHWGRGLGVNAAGVGEPNSIIMQATANALADMRAKPATPSKITVDNDAAPQVTGRTPAPDATGVATTTKVTATFAQSPDPATITTSSFTLKKGTTSIAASVSYDAETRTATLTPKAQLDGVSTYTATLTTAIKSWNGTPMASDVTWSFTTAGGSPPAVTARTPSPGSTGVAFNVKPTATFDRALDATTVNNASFTLTPQDGGTLPATVAYDSETRTATLTPNALLAGSTTYTARVTTAVRASDGTALASDVTWTFTTKASAGPFEVTSRVPAPLSNGISPATHVRAEFSRSVDPGSLTASTFTLRSGDDAVPATISYDDTTRTATLTPTATLATMTTYTATLTTGVRAAEDDTRLASDVSWTFTTAFSPPPAPAVAATSPLAGVTGVRLDTTVQATFDTAMDSATLNGQTFTLTAAGAPPTVAGVTYDANSRTATLRPSSPLAVSKQYTARVTTGARSSVGTPLSSDVTWTFTTLDCPCQLFSDSLTPQNTNLSTQDGRSGTGPWTYELGVKFTVDAPVDVTSLRFYKDAAETGTHVGRLWGPTGNQLALVTFADETPSGWQSQKLATPVTLQPGDTYVASVGVNSRWVSTLYALGSPVVSGPLRTIADGANGVYGSAAGVFPTQTWGNSNYFVDVVVKGAGQATAVPHVVGQQPAAGATGVGQTARVKATFDIDVDPSTVTASTFKLTGPDNTAIPASVLYDASTRTATLTPDAAFDALTTYTATVTTGVRSEYGVAMAQAATWRFATASNPPPGVESTSPAAGATNVSPYDSVRATFNQAMTASSIDDSTFTLKATASDAAIPASVTYNSATRTATLTPALPLTALTSYTATVTTGAKNADGVPLASAHAWTFTTSSCPCRLFSDATTPQLTQLTTQDGRSGPGPWSYELGVKFKVTSPAKLAAIRFFKSQDELGTHTGRLWNATGTLLASTTFSGETASGWQGASFTDPVELTPNQTYVVSVGFNAFFSMTFGALADEIVNGPLRSIADGNNGVYGQTAGVFPTSSYNNSSYLVDPVVG